MSVIASRRERRPDALGAPAIVAWAVAAVVLLVALALWQDDGYWEYSDGVYALTARLVADGRDLYGDVAAAQPPPLYLAGALVLSISDTLTALRIAMAAVELVTSALVLAVVWRLTGQRAAAVLAALVVLVSPWMLREHAQLLPETFAAPLLLGAALAASRARTVVLAGVLAALATAFKLAFGLPALALLLGVRLRGDRVRGIAAFAAAAVVLGLLSLLLYGDGLLDGAVRAQRESGTAAVSYVAGLWAQGAWNLLPLLACAVLVVPLRAWLLDDDLLRTLAAGSAGALLLFLTLFKTGSYLTFLVVVEPLLVCLAAAGVVAAVRAGSAALTAVAGIALLLGALQVGSLLLAPGDPRLFVRPLADSGPERKLSPAEVDAAVAQLRACPADRATGAPPYIAFAAGRRIAGDQPDQFILAHAPVLAEFRAVADADQPRCP
ncbi:hypothetical protein [Conexibacter woesei]|uniref:Glycosyltransferase RgtA/B/C/D-like domain-containing protein n=1 Tax=Conexibacter woesei (strain DSM 14684 / CCUG 47730 / CIP 108061 / JCM 11494 / NBRC 100937 / ID131577) TaxID=469383 RepID=D3FD26_CONWI|nr:hypothetical protein [Conexibacter woesei]ADB51538.1 hypothetical protein Cwoe_3119 [Conexibacter woesei DSM 14684]